MYDVAFDEMRNNYYKFEESHERLLNMEDWIQELIIQYYLTGDNQKLENSIEELAHYADIDLPSFLRKNQDFYAQRAK